MFIRHIKSSGSASQHGQPTQETGKRVSPFLRLTVLALIFLLLPTTGFAEKQKTIYISPFKIHAQKDISFLKDAMRAMMASRLAATAKLKIVDDKAGADYTLHGDITAIGNTLSINAKINASDGSIPEATYYASATSENEIIPAVDLLAANISRQSFSGKVMTAPAAVANQQAPPAMAPALVHTPTPQPNAAFQTAHPDRAFLKPGQHSMPAMQPEQQGSGLIKPMAITATSGFKKTRNFPMAMQDMAVGDVDGDGTDDLIVASPSEIFAYQMAGTNLAPFGQISLPSNQKIISMEMADLDQDGRSEIYITSVDRNNRPSGMAVRWENNRFSYLFQNQRWFIKPISTPGRGKILAGQHRGIEFPMAKGVYELAIVDGQLKEVTKLTLPAETNIYNFAMADLDGDGVTEVIFIDNDDKLHVSMTGGRKLWTGDDHYGGSLRFIGGKSITRRKGGAVKQPVMEGNDTNQDRMYIHSRIIITDVNNDNQPDIIVNKNLSSASRIFKNFKAYPSGEIHALSWNGIGLSELWRTQKIDGYVASYDFRHVVGTSQSKLYVGLILNSGWMDMLSAKDSTVLIYPLANQ